MANLLTIAGLFLGRGAESWPKPSATAAPAASSRSSRRRSTSRSPATEPAGQTSPRDPAYVTGVLHEGNARANDVAERTLATVRAVMGMSY